jgi:competence protein ComEC
MQHQQHIWGGAGATLLAAVAALLGVGLYFALPTEPTLTAVAGLSMAAVVAWAVLRRRGMSLALPVGLAAMLLLTVLVCVLHTLWRATPMLPEADAGTRLWLTGTVTALQPGVRTTRLVLANAQSHGEAVPPVPPRVRVSLAASRAAGIRPGDTVSAEVMLYPPRAPAFEGDYNARRTAFFEGVGAVGMVRGQVYVTPPEVYTPWQRLHALRYTLAARLATHDGVAAALLTGVRGYVPPQVAEAYRASGLAHLMAISGLHVGMVAGMVFFGLQRLFALWPWLVLTYPARKGAALAALLLTVGYALLAGMSIPTTRALIMVAALLLAVMLDRLRSSLHILSLAAILAIWLWPEAALGASFQMSFIAALALVLWMRQKPSKAPSALGWVRQVGYFQGVWATSVVAGLATLPLAGWHFGVVSLAGFATNMAAIPLMGFVVMPLALASLGGHLFGGIGWIDGLYAQACQWLTAVAGHGAGWSLAFPLPAQAALPVLALAWGAVVLYISGRFRWAVLVTAAMVAVILSAPVFLRQPDLLALNGGQTLLVRQSNGVYYKALLAGDDTEKRLLKRLAQRRHLQLVRPDGEVPCDSIGCVYTLDGARSLLVVRPHSLPEKDDCDRMFLIAGVKAGGATVCPQDMQISDYKEKRIYLTPQAEHEVIYTPPARRPWH